MVKISKQHSDKNHKYSIKALLAEGKIDPTYKALMSAFCQVVTDKLGLDSTVKSPKILGSTEIAQSVSQHYNYVELVVNEILTLGEDYNLFPEFGVFVNKNAHDNTFSCISFKLKRGNGYFIQISRFIGKNIGMYETKIKIGQNWELIKSETILGLYDAIDDFQSNTNQQALPKVDLSDFEATESHYDSSESDMLIEAKT